MQMHLVSLLAAATALVCPTQSVFAGDLPIKAPVYKAPRSVPAQPGGFYFGGHIGGGWTYNSFADPSNTLAASIMKAHASGFLGGVQAGYNWQFGLAVIGIQGDISFTDLNAATRAPLIPTTTVANDTKWISTLTGRSGYTWYNSLWYIKGGAAWVRNHYGLLDPVMGFFTSNETRSGYVVGGGVEYAIAPNWSAFAEYNFIELTDKNFTLVNTGPGVLATGDVYQNIHLLKVGINYKLPASRW